MAESPLRLDRRGRSNFKEWAVIITLVIQLCGFVWQAAQLTSAVSDLKENQKDTRVEISSLVRQLNTNTTNIEVLKTIVQGIQK